MTSSLRRLHPAVVAVVVLMLIVLSAILASSAKADSNYTVALCGYNAAGGQAGTWSDLSPGPYALSICNITDASGGRQGAGATDDAVFYAPAYEAITVVDEVGAHYVAAHTSADEDWSVGFGLNISGNNAVYTPALADCSNNAGSHLYTYGGANSLTTGCNNSIGGAIAGGFSASNVGLIAVCHATSCPSNGSSGASLNGLLVNLQDPYNAPAIGAGGSLWNAANRGWVSGLNEGASLSLSYNAYDPGSVCTLVADLVNTSGAAVASSTAASATNWDGASWATAQPCAASPSGTLAPNLASLPTGTYYLNVVAQNPGNVQLGGASWASGGTWVQGRALNVDNSPPTGSVTTTARSGVWYGSAQTVTVDASDVGSGLDYVSCVGPGAPSTAIAASQLPYTITVSAQGSDTITCDATDNAGNMASLGSATVNIDTTVPTATLSSGIKSDVWYSSIDWPTMPTVAVNTTSGPSGIASITCQAPGMFDTLTRPGGAVSVSGLRDGADTITCTPMSGAGVTGTPATLLVHLDSQTPTLSFSGHASQTKWYPTVASIPDLDANASTGPSGLALIDCSGDGVPNQSATANGAAVTLTGLQQGTGTVTCTATSVAGLTSTPQTFTLNLDSAAPTVAWRTGQSPATWYPSTSSVPALGLDATAGGPSGVDHITCSGDGFSAPVSLQGATGTLHPTGFDDGTNTISCVPYSGAGVAGAAITRTILVDSTHPAVTLSGTDSSTWYPSAQTVAADASHDSNPSGIQSISCSVDGGSAAITDGDHAAQAVSGDGVHTVSCRALSRAGVAGPAATTAVRIDTQTPVVTQTIVPAAPSDPAGTVAVLVTAAEPQPLSGIASTSCSLDHQPATVVQGDRQTVAATSAGVHTLVCSATSQAGVTGADSTETYRVASDPSQFSLQYGTIPTTWQPGPVTVPVKLTGATAQNYSSLTCTEGDGSPTNIEGISGTVDVTTSGRQQLACYATANDGASTAALTQTVKIDEQTPTAAWSTNATPTGAQVTLTGSEQTPLSGIASESCSVDGGPAQTTDTPNLTVAIDQGGAHQLDCTITSGAGITAHISHTANVTVPVPAPRTVSAPDPGRWYHAAQSIVLAIPSSGPTITAVRCTHDGTTSSYPVTGTTVSVNVPAPGGDVQCLDVDGDGQQSATVDFAVHIDTGAPTGYFLQTGPSTAVASVLNPGGSGIQSVTVQYQIGSGAWVTIPGVYDATRAQIAVALPAALRQPGVRYALQAIAVNNAGGRTIIATMKDGTPATGTEPADTDAGAVVRGGLYVGTVPPGGRVRVAKMVPETRKLRIHRHGRTLVRIEPVYRTVTRRITVHGRTVVRHLRVRKMRRTYVWQTNTAALAHTLTVGYGQTVSLTATLSLRSGQVGGQTATIVDPDARSRQRLTATTQADGTFNVRLDDGPSRPVTYTIAGVTHSVAIRVRGKVAVTLRRAASHPMLELVALGATGRVAYRLQRDRDGHWFTVGGTRLTNSRGRGIVHLPTALAKTPSGQLRVPVTSQPTWRFLNTTQRPAVTKRQSGASRQSTGTPALDGRVAQQHGPQSHVRGGRAS